MSELDADPLVVTVSEFSQRLKTVFRRVPAFSRVGVSGEISEVRASQYGLGFTLKDQNAILKCFAFSKYAKLFPAVENGAAITAFGSVEVQEKWGYYQLLVTELRLTGVGELHQQFLVLKEQFRAQGLFEIARKRRIPTFPLHVALVSAGQGKGADDFLKTMHRGAPHVRVTFIETRVQGDGAEIDIAEAVDNAAKTGADLIVLARGGGSYEDLFPFNLEPVVRAVVRSAIPVVTGIGHSDDHHLADDVADAVFGTPSIAAESIVKQWDAGKNRLASTLARLDRETTRLRAQWLQSAGYANEALRSVGPRYVERRRQAVAQRVQALTVRSPQRRVAEMRAAFAGASTKLGAGALRMIELRRGATAMRVQSLTSLRERPIAENRRAVERLEARLDTLSPEGPLERGYAIITFAGTPLLEAGDVKPGDTIAARLHHGTITARVEKAE